MKWREGGAGRDAAESAAIAAAPLLAPGAPRSASTAAGAPARPKSKLANASGFYDAPPAPDPRMHAALRRAADACWDSGMLCAVVSYIMFSLSAFCVKLTDGAPPAAWAGEPHRRTSV